MIDGAPYTSIDTGFPVWCCPLADRRFPRSDAEFPAVAQQQNSMDAAPRPYGPYVAQPMGRLAVILAADYLLCWHHSRFGTSTTRS